MSNDELRAKLKDCLIRCLERKGWPNLSITETLRYLKDCWVAMEDEGLIQPGMTYAAFRFQAEETAIAHMTTDEGIEWMWSKLNDE